MPHIALEMCRAHALAADTPMMESIGFALEEQGIVHHCINGDVYASNGDKITMEAAAKKKTPVAACLEGLTPKNPIAGTTPTLPVPPGASPLPLPPSPSPPIPLPRASPQPPQIPPAVSPLLPPPRLSPALSPPISRAPAPTLSAPASRAPTPVPSAPASKVPTPAPSSPPKLKTPTPTESVVDKKMVINKQTMSQEGKRGRKQKSSGNQVESQLHKRGRKKGAAGLISDESARLEQAEGSLKRKPDDNISNSRPRKKDMHNISRDTAGKQPTSTSSDQSHKQADDGYIHKEHLPKNAPQWAVNGLMVLDRHHSLPEFG
ncbi:hypothetical protein ARMGADRAFT_1086983 [Armillaria gallica]|uniref:Uncharacterized protein n=1 Tax=Armillaria gallica TaxID=47427 RepID=A0A2H3DA35_ARMGA|nr:hypothetical protein ARMGADRAFT_1086983 [Armillaria gallica]